jgi:hypothetical protein
METRKTRGQGEKAETLNSQMEAAERVNPASTRALLNWLVDFAQREIPEEAAGLTAIQGELRWFLRYAMLRITQRAMATLSEDQPRDATGIRDLQKSLIDGLRETANHEPWAVPLDGLKRVVQPEHSYYEGPFYRVLLQLAADLIEREGRWVGRCARKDCRRFFVKKTSARYCSRRCSKLDRDARFIESHPVLSLEPKKRGRPPTVTRAITIVRAHPERPDGNKVIEEFLVECPKKRTEQQHVDKNYEHSITSLLEDGSHEIDCAKDGLVNYGGVRSRFPTSGAQQRLISLAAKLKKSVPLRSKRSALSPTIRRKVAE